MIFNYRLTLERLIKLLLFSLGVLLLVLFPFGVNSQEIIKPLTNLPFFYLLAGACGLFILSSLAKLASKGACQFRLVDIIMIASGIYVLLRVGISRDNILNRDFIELVALMLIYVSIRFLEPQYYKVILISLLLAALAQAVYGQLQLYGVYSSYHSQFNITGSFFNPAPYAGYLSSIFPIAIIIYYINNEKHYKYAGLTTTIIKYISIATALTILIVLPATQSRAAWLSALITGALLLMIYSKEGKRLLVRLKARSKKQTVYLVLSLGLLLCSLLAMYYLKKDSADGRLLIWQVATEMLKDKPLLGFGPNGFESHYMLHQADFFLNHPNHLGIILADNTNYAYNELLKISVEYGIIGLILALGLLFSVFKSSHSSIAFIGAKYGFFALLVFSMFSYPSNILSIKLNFIVFVAIIAAYSKPLVQLRVPYTKAIWGVCLVAFMLVLPMGYRWNRQYYSALCSWRDASDIYRVEAYEECLDDFKLAYPVLKTNGDFLVQYGKALSMAHQDKEAIEILELAKNSLNNTILYTTLGDSYSRMGNYDKGEEAFVTAYQMVPNRFYPLYLLAKMYYLSGQYEKAQQMIEQTLNKDVKIPSRAIEEIREEMQEMLSKIQKNN